MFQSEPAERAAGQPVQAALASPSGQPQPAGQPARRDQPADGFAGTGRLVQPAEPATGSDR